MNFPNEAQLQPLINAVDTAAWCWSVKKHTRKGQACKVDWKSAFDELCEAWEKFQIATDDRVAVPSVASQGDRKDG